MDNVFTDLNLNVPRHLEQSGSCPKPIKLSQSFGLLTKAGDDFEVLIELLYVGHWHKL